MMQLGGTPTTTAAATTAATATAPLQSNNNDSAATEAAAAAVGAFEVSEEMHDRGFGGNRWPRQETLALLKIRSDMGIAFRDASVKGPLWEEVSRKMAELGYIRNAKKCKEKFENVYKYHKRTKEGRTGKSEGKTYRFFDQLEALESQSTTSLHHPQSQSQPLQPRPPQNNNSIFSTPPPVTTVMPPGANMSTLPSSSIPPYTQQINVPSFPNISGDFLSDNSTSSSSSYSTSSDMEIGGGTTTTRKKRKRKWKEFFERLMKQVVDKQEELQRKFLEAVEKREHERLVREESWRVQEIARINREHEILAQERSMSAAKDAAVMAFLQKLSEKQPNQPTAAQPQPQQVRPQMQLNNNSNQQQTPQPSPAPPPPPLPQPIQAVVPTLDTPKTDNGDQNMTPASASSSRWPKVEIEALIKLRTNLDSKYQENGPKGPLWEEISAGMRRLGFNRNSKRCKEKWENINKYFKKVKESNKKRPEDSKTCPYFHQLDALYRERNKFHSNNVNIATASSSASGLVKPDNSVPLMVQPEQQWPPAVTTATTTTTPAVAAAQPDQHPQPSDQNFDDEEGTDEEYDDEDEDEENEEEEGGEFELVPSNNNNNKTTNNL
ncbi:SANT/Myb domain [Arabidopsis thaliana x Arabidopsis arenosa]|uniref:SANT/Myb domain n=1 Tax=Arabidopsis thaliana x Arabidopsis arenosa TaxID=1240361 RepID=A0A8T2BLP0_9BRAS|nr:SANT/Myb domain [Arabidopsis thaliana x Arabidopsis arenosa]